MPITEKQLEARKKRIGSSDMASILGLSPYQTAYDVWAVKTGRMPNSEGNDATLAGTRFEPGVLDYAEDVLGKLIRNQYRSAKDVPIGANIDALVVSTGEPVEAKTAGLLAPLQEHWGQPDTDEVPDRVIIQAHVHLLCTEQELCHIAAFLGGRGFVPFRVHRDETVIEVIKETALKFWEHVETDTPPDNSLPTATTIKKMRRTPETVVPVDTALVKHWLELKAAKSDITKEFEAAQITMLAQIGDAEAGECDLGLLTYFEQERKEYTVAASKYRVARFKEKK